MSDDNYSMKTFFLQFQDKVAELRYKDFIFDRTLWFCRISWGLAVLLGGSFALLDHQMFGEDGNIVILVRLILITLSVLVLILTFSPQFKKFMDLSSFLFIIFIGLFCTFLIVMSDSSTFSPYFVGLLFAFTGILTTAGLGFKYSFFALLMNFIIFESAIHFLSTTPFIISVLYNFFLISILLIFGYIGYFIEIISRKNFIANTQLYNSLSQVKQLSGLLPICSSCKNIRDDKGYWEQIETYIGNHSEADFSHSICPECVKKLYPDLNIHKYRIDRK